MSEIQNDINPIIFNRPNIIYIQDYEYRIKEELSNNFFSYRCKKRKDCWIVIKVSKEELKKYMENNNYKINYTINGKKKEHTCKSKESNTDEKNCEDKKVILNEKKKENIRFVD